MTADDPELKQSDEIIAPDDAPDGELDGNVDEKKGDTHESGWANFPHSLQSLKDHDPEAWGAFIARQNQIAEKLILGRFSRGSNKVTVEDAQDLAAQLYNKLAEKIRDFNTLEAVGAWFVKALERDALDLIATNKAAKHGGGKVDSLDAGSRAEVTDKFSRAREYTNEYHKLHDRNFNWEVGHQQNPEDAAMLSDVRRNLELCIRRLKQSEQQFIEYEQLQFTHDEIAKKCGCGTKEVGSRLNRIHKKLAKCLRTLN